MKSPFIKIWLFLSFLFFASGIGLGAKERKDASVPRLSLETVLDKEKVVEGERVIYEVKLISDTPDIAGFELLEYPDFSRLPAVQSAADSHIKTLERKGEKFYSVVIDRYFIGAEENGKIRLNGGNYRIGINHPVTVNNPFWGPSLVNRVETIDLSAPDLTLSVSSLPQKGKPENFSGAIGQYEIKATLPKKSIRVGEKGMLTIIIDGKGDLTNTPAPDVRAAFREGLTFRSMTDDKEHFITQGSLGSEMRIKCIFTAEEPGRYTILPISFTFYDSDSKKYKTVSTSPLELEVLPAIEKEGTPPVYHSI